MIQLKHINYSYNGTIALIDISFEIKKGEKVVLMGVNGSGKSTILKLLDGLIYPQQGEYFFKNDLLTKKKLKDNTYNTYFRSSVAMLFQKPDIMLFNPTVYDELAFSPRQLNSKSIDDEVEYWANRFKITHLLKKQPFNLSCGEKKKVALASLMIIDPELLILDEPFSYLDPQSTEWLVDFLKQLNKTIIISLHNLKIASLFSKRLLVLSKKHKLIYNGNIEPFSTSSEKLKDAGMFTKLNTI
jgi:cobalt/nickel transport system ATP-binding protein